MRYKLFSNVIYSYLSVLVASCVSFVSVTLIIHHFGNEQFGLFTLTTDILTWFSILNFGIPWVIAVTFAKISDKNLQKILIYRGIILLLCISGIFLVIVIVLNVFIPNWFSMLIKIPSNLRTLASTFVFISVVFFLFKLPISIFNQLLIFINKAYLAKIIEILLSVANLCSLLLIIYSGYSIISYAMVSGFLSLVISLFNVFVFRTIWNNSSYVGDDTTIKFYNEREVSYKHIITNGYYFFINGIGGLVLWNSASIIIGHFLDLVSVTKYALMFKIFNVLFMLITQVMNVVNPIFSTLYNRDHVKLVKVYQLTTILFPVIGGIVFIFIFGFLKEFIYLWLNKSTLYPGKAPALFMGFYCYFLCSSIIPYSILMSLNFSKYLYKYTLLESLINIIIALLLVNVLGIAGVSIAGLVAHISVMFVAMPKKMELLTNKVFIFNYKAVLKNFLIVLLCSVLIFEFNYFIPFHILFKMIFLAILSLLYILLSYVILDRKNKLLIYSFINSRT